MARSKLASSKSSKRTNGNRLRTWLVGGGGVIALVLIIAVVLNGTLNEPLGGIPEGTREVAVEDPAHVEGKLYGENEVVAGGAHSAAWANCGFYNEPVPAENAVHSLEHGAVWITYQPTIPEDDVAALRRLARPSEKVLASLIAVQSSPILATAWGYQLELDSADDPRLGQFIVEFAGSPNAPEPGGACTGGVGVPS